MNGFSTPQEMANKFRWYGHKNTYRRGTGNVTIGHNKAGAYITFRDDTFKHFKSGKVEIAFSDDCVLFRDSEENGMKLTEIGAPSPNKKQIKFYRNDVAKLLREFEGDYELKYQRQFGLYYVTKGEE